MEKERKRCPLIKTAHEHKQCCRQSKRSEGALAESGGH